jgi:hypothetical protein
MSGLSKGMEMGAVNNQNASDMIDKLTTAGRRRVTMSARDFARTFLVPLSQHICKLAMENDQTQDQIEMKGQIIPVVPSQWSDDDLEMEVAAALTPDEAQRNASQLMMLHTQMMQDPSMGQIYSTVQKHALFDHIFDLLGVKNTTSFMMSPNSPEYQQMMQQQQQQQQAEMQEQMVMQELQKDMMANQSDLAASQAEALRTNAQVNMTDKLFDNTLNEAELDHKKFVDVEKLRLDGAKLGLEGRKITAGNN